VQDFGCVFHTGLATLQIDSDPVLRHTAALVTIERLFAPELGQPFSAYSHGIAVSQATRTVFVSGQLGVAPDGSIPPLVSDQIRFAWDNIESVLRAGRMTLANVVRIRGYITSREALPDYRAALEARLGQVRPASSLLIVADLVAPEFLVEIEAVAVEVSS
jgi:2-iminobutanoate/2-iminopropanoate deaminase